MKGPFSEETLTSLVFPGAEQEQITVTRGSPYLKNDQ